MNLSVRAFSLSTLFSVALATTAPVVKAQPKILNYSTSNPPAEVPSPSLIELERSSELNPPQIKQSTTPLTKTSLNQPTVTLTQPIVMAPVSNNMQILDKNTPAEVSSPSLQNYQH